MALQNRRCYIELNFSYDGDKNELLSKLNTCLNTMRNKTGDLILLPFKSSERRRLTITQAKGIVEKVLQGDCKKEELW